MARKKTDAPAEPAADAAETTDAEQLDAGGALAKQIADQVTDEAEASAPTWAQDVTSGLEQLVADGTTPEEVMAAIRRMLKPEPEPEPEPELDDADAMPRRRLMVSIRAQADDVGGICRCMIELIHLLERAERAAPGPRRPLGEFSHADGDNTRSYSIEIDDDPEIGAADYALAVQRWRDSQAEAAPGA